MATQFEFVAANSSTTYKRTTLGPGLGPGPIAHFGSAYKAQHAKAQKDSSQHDVSCLPVAGMIMKEVGLQYLWVFKPTS